MASEQTTILAPRRFWCSECQGDGCLMCEGTGDNERWRAMSMAGRAAERDLDLAAMLRSGSSA